jgi:outer membrane immunogenic protein
MGAVVGAGVEWIFWQNWSAFVQWDHYFFGDNNVAFTCTVGGCGGTTQLVRISQDIDTFRAGVNWRFSWWPH